MEIKLVINDGIKHIQAGDAVVPVDDALEACTQGVFDPLGGQFYKVIRLYLDNGTYGKDASLTPFFRQMVALGALDWVAEKYGAPEWRHRQIRMPLDLEVIRTGLIYQIEGALATVPEGEPLEVKASNFYQAMLMLSEGGGLSQMGKETLTEMFDSILDGFIDDGMELPTRH